MSQRRKVWVGGAGIGVDLVCVAAAALGAPAPIWILALLLGSALILYAFVVGEPAPETLQPADGGSGDGNVRGNVFGDNATISIGERAPSQEPSHGKTLLRVSLAQLYRIYEDHTEVQAEKLAETYIGGWLELQGTINDVSRPHGSERYRVSLDIEEDPELVFLEFSDHLQEHLPRLQRGAPINVVGRLSKISSLWLDWEACEFID